MKLPETFVYAPWNLVHHDGELRLAYLTKLFGGGIVFGPCNGGRGHLATDDGQIVEAGEPVVFREADLVYEWRNRPSTAQLELARSREAQALAA